MKVRAVRDGHYGGYYRLGPIYGDQGNFDGEVFEIDEKPFVVKDIEGKPVIEVDEKGKAVIDPVTKTPKIKMGSWFAPMRREDGTIDQNGWMEKVSDDTLLTAQIDPKFDYPPFEIPIQYRERKPYASKTGKTGFIPSPGAAPNQAAVI